MRRSIPDQTSDITRRALRVRKNFTEELLRPKLGSKELKELLGDERYRTPADEWTDEENAKVKQATSQAGKKLFGEKVSAALDAIENELGVEQAVYVSAGLVYEKHEEKDKVKTIEWSERSGIEMVSWPMAHNVRPAGWSLGITGCTECHQESGLIFASTVVAKGPGPDQGDPISMATLQNIDPDQRLAWNQLFKGRSTFKYIVAGSIGFIALILLLSIGMMLGRRSLNHAHTK